MDREHFKLYAEIKDTATTEKDRPSLHVPAPKVRGRKRRAQANTPPPEASGTPPPDSGDISSSQVEENQDQEHLGNFKTAMIFNK